MERKGFWLLAAVVVLLAFVIRDLYIAQAVIWRAFDGDAGYYVRYAQNIAQGYFGYGAVPDGYRPPGYPALIALTEVLGSGYDTLLKWQALMGAATVGFTIALGRQWLPAWGALLAGLLLAFWPHHIAFTAEVLSEVFYGFLLSAALLVAALAKHRAWAWGCAGLLFACAAMVNSVAVLIPLLAGAAVIGRQSPARWAALLTPVVLIVGGWSMRPVDGGSDRIWQNLVQGSHPIYHEAYVQQHKDAEMGRITAEINAEVAATVEDPSVGLQAMGGRFADRPGYYLAWYVRKAWLLWDWDVRISPVGGPYMHYVRSPMLEAPPLQQVSDWLRVANPVLFALALTFAALALFKPGPARMIGLAFLYVTAVHFVLQAEPRYSIPYRPLQLLCAVSALAWAIGAARLRNIERPRVARASPAGLPGHSENRSPG